MADNAENRLFALQNHGVDFFTGVCHDGRRVVMGLLCPHLVAYFFDADGKLLGDEHRPWDTPPPRFGANGPYKIYDNTFQKTIASQLQKWQRAIGFEPATIHIRAFMDRRHPVGIKLVPEHLCNLDVADWFEDEEERNKFVASREEWLAEEKFVWWWAKDYYVTKDGEVEST